MKLCPYCKGEVADNALKCMHCGEWVDGSRGTGSTLAKAAMIWVVAQIGFGLIILTVMAVLFFKFFLPHFRDFPKF